MSGIVGTHTDDELRDLFASIEDIDVSFFSNSTVRQFVAHLLMKGHLQDDEVLITRLKELLGDLTFKEAHEKSGLLLL